jgi:hypothetical protein
LEKINYFVKIKSHLNENIERRCMQFESNLIIGLRLNSFEFKIQLKRNEMQIAGEFVKNLFMNKEGVEKQNFNKIIS